jgi:hypothetical protein
LDGTSTERLNSNDGITGSTSVDIVALAFSVGEELEVNVGFVSVNGLNLQAGVDFVAATL